MHQERHVNRSSGTEKQMIFFDVTIDEEVNSVENVDISGNILQVVSHK